MTEAFGRTIVEALAVGVPVVTDERFTRLFGDAVIVATPQSSMDRVCELLSDPAAYEALAQRGRRWVLAHCDVRQHLERLRGFGLSR
jgi:glycosyltransferase involved in cell wall biosynthesis